MGREVEIAIWNRIEKKKGKEGNNALFGGEDLTMEDEETIWSILMMMYREVYLKYYRRVEIMLTCRKVGSFKNGRRENN